MSFSIERVNRSVRRDITANSISATSQTVPNIVVFNGVFRNASGGSPRFAHWGGDTLPNSFCGTLLIPFSGRIIGVGVSYIHDSTPISIGAGEGMEFVLGKIPAGDASSEAVFDANVIPDFSLNFTETDNGTYPQKCARYGVSLDVNAMDKLAAKVNETGTVTPTNFEVGITLWVELDPFIST